MSTIKVDVSSSKKPVLQVGYQEENEVTDVLFDISAWVEEYGGGTAGLRVKRPQNSEEESYELSLPISENVATWTVSETDTYNRGNGKVQLKYYVGSALKESAVYTYKVGKSIVGSDNPVDPFDTWIERSKAWAIGELLDDEEVPPSDETYRNNSKFYAEQTKEYAHQFVGAPRAASTAADMTDHDLIYVFTGTTTSSLTNGHWYSWNGSAWTDGGVYNSTAFTTDTTLSVPGAAADAKAVGDLKGDLNFEISARTVADSAIQAITNELYNRKINIPVDDNNQPSSGIDGQILRTKGDGSTEWVNVGLPTNEQTSQAVTAWMNDHPEATTTVLDNSLTLKKFVSGEIPFVTPEQFGAIGDGIVDDSTALTNAFQHECVFLSNKTYKVSNQIPIESSLIISNNAIISGIVEGYTAYKDSLSYEDLGIPTTTIVKGDTNIPIDAITSNDDICINSTDLFNPVRNYYNCGEFNTVKINGQLEHGYYDNYITENTKIYKVNFGKFSVFGNLTIINNDTSGTSGAFMIRGVKGLDIKGLHTYSNGGYSLHINRCYKGSIEGVFIQECTTNHGLDYGCCISNSQDVIINGFMSGYRHGLTIGGGSGDLNIVNRNIKASGIFDNDINSNVVALNMHGNCEFCDFSGNTSTGVNVAGKNHKIHDLIITNDEKGLGFTSGNEMLAGSFIYDNIICSSKRSAYGFVFGSNVTTENNYDVLISNCIIKNPSTGLFAFSGTTTDTGNLILSNIKHIGPDVTYTVNVTHAVINKLKVFLKNAIFNSLAFTNCDVITDVFYRGEATITFDNSTYATAYVDPPINYNIGGNVKVSISRPMALGHLILPFVYNVYAKRFQVIAYTADTAAVTGTVTVQYELS